MGDGRSQNRDPGSPAFQRPSKKKSQVRRQGSQTQKKVMETPVGRVSGRERPAWPDVVGTTRETSGMLRRKDLRPPSEKTDTAAFSHGSLLAKSFTGRPRPLTLDKHSSASYHLVRL